MKEKQHVSSGIPQDVIMERSQIMKASYDANVDRFKAFDQDLNQDYSDKIAAKITEIDAIMPDKIMLVQQQKATKFMLDTSKSAVNNVKNIRYYVEKAFPDNALMLSEFGYNNLAKVQHSQLKLIKHLKIFVISLKAYKAELMAKGLAEAMILETIQLAADVEDANINQELAKKARYKTTGLRIKAFDELLELLANVTKAARYIFQEEPDQLRDYILENASKKKTVKKGGEEVEPAFLQGTLTDAETNEAIEDAIVEIVNAEFSTVTDEDGEFYIDQIIPGTYSIRIAAFGYKDLEISGVELASGNETQEFAYTMEKEE